MLPRNRIPLTLKIAYTAFMVVLVQTYWIEYGPTNFLYFCDVALFFALGAVWLESPLLASMPIRTGASRAAATCRTRAGRRATRARWRRGR